MKAPGLWKLIFVVLVPWTAVCAIWSDDAVRLANEAFGLALQKGHVAIVYLLVFLLVTRVGYRNDKKRLVANGADE